jgi:hypothetical protein
MNDVALIDAFVAEFPKRDNRIFREFSLRGGVTAEDVAPLLTEPWQVEEDVDGGATWQPLRVQTSPDALKTLYEAVPGPLPPLYEQLILTYHWGEVDLDRYRLLPHFPPALDGLIKVLKADAVLFQVLSSNGLVQFGRGPEIDYDPVCFDLSKRSADGDCAIIKADHEDILNHERLRVVGVLAGSFRELVRQTITENPVLRQY